MTPQDQRFNWNNRDYMNGVAKTLNINGTVFSAVCHDGSYGGKNGLWEIGIWEEDGDWITKDIFGGDDDVRGYLTWTEVIEMVEKTYDYVGARICDQS